MSTHDTPATYNREEAVAIRELVLEGKSPICPRCDEPLTLRTPVALDAMIVQEVSCPMCHRCVIIREEETRSREPGVEG
jgi:hypothetical protein